MVTTLFLFRVSILEISNNVGFLQTAHTLHVYGGYSDKDRRETLYEAAMSVARSWRRRADWLQEENDTMNRCIFYSVDTEDLLEDQYYQCAELRQNFRVALTALQNVTGSRSNARMALDLTYQNRFPKQLADRATSFFSESLKKAHDDEGPARRSWPLALLPFPCRWVKDWPMTTPVTEEHESSDGAEYGHDGPLDFPTCAAEQPRGYGPMDLQTSAAAEVQASASSQGVLDLTSALAKEGMIPGTTSNSDAKRSHEGTRRAWRKALARTSAAGEPAGAP